MGLHIFLPPALFSAISKYPRLSSNKILKNPRHSSITLPPKPSIMLDHIKDIIGVRRCGKTTGAAVETAEKYIGYLKESMLIYELPLFSFKLKTGRVPYQLKPL